MPDLTHRPLFDPTCPHWSEAGATAYNSIAYYARLATCDPMPAFRAKALEALEAARDCMAHIEIIGLLRQAGVAKPYKIPGV